MAYIGTPVQQALTKVTSQSFNGTGSQTVFTLNRAVNTGEELEVFVNNVQQEPGVGKSYTATGTTLTFDAAPASGTGNIYVIYRGLAEVTRRLEHDPNAALAATTGTFSDGITVDKNGATVATFDRATSDGSIVDFQKSGSTVGSIGVVGGHPQVASASGYLGIGGSTGSPFMYSYANALYPTTDNFRDLGTSGTRFKDLHLSGGVVFGATGGNVTGKTLDDYEEGNWTPQFGGSSTTGTGTYSTTVGRYVKVGKKVNCWGIIVSSGTHNGTGTLQIHGLPFTKENTYLSWGTETNIAYHFGFTSYGSFTNVIRLLGPVSNGTYIRFHAFGNTGDTSVPPTPANVQSGTSVYFSATYEVQ